MTQKQDLTGEQQLNINKMLSTASDKEVISLLITLAQYEQPFYIDTLLRMLIENRSEIVKREITEFISKIKLPQVVESIANFISTHYKTEDINLIITASWQSTLDFSQHLAPYFDLFISQDYLTAFEAFTVIENNINGLSKQELTHYKGLLHKALPQCDETKQRLVTELMEMIDGATINHQADEGEDASPSHDPNNIS